MLLGRAYRGEWEEVGSRWLRDAHLMRPRRQWPQQAPGDKGAPLPPPSGRQLL